MSVGCGLVRFGVELGLLGVTGCVCFVSFLLILESPPPHPPKRTNGADRRSDHSGTTQQGAQQPPATENLRETNVELREENPKTSPENIINTFCGAP